MSFQTIKGQSLAVTLVQRWLALGTNQPLLFYGPEGSGKRSLALEVAKALNCAQAKETEACGTCLSCRKISAGHHPDVKIIDLAYQAEIRGEAVEKQQFLRIETIQEERKRLYQTVLEGPWKVGVVCEAHRMTADAANVLLKVLEEPPPRTAIFLLTPYRDRIFSTLLSRCQPVRFRSSASPAGPADLEIEALWKKLPGMKAGQILAGQASRASRAEIEDQIQRLLSPALRDLRSGRTGVADKIEFLQQAQQQLRQNVPPSLVYDQLLLNLSKAQ